MVFDYRVIFLNFWDFYLEIARIYGCVFVEMMYKCVVYKSGGFGVLFIKNGILGVDVIGVF